MEAKTIQDVDRALLDVTWNENIMAADSNGNIGYWHPGLHPLRPTGFDDRLPYPGTGEAEWRGLLDRRQTPHVINPKRGWLVNWNNTPSTGWIEGDQEARERLSGGWHRVAWLQKLVRRMAKAPTFAAAQKVVEEEGSYSQQRPIATARLRRARRGASGNAAAVLDALLAWDGSYHRTDGNGTVDPGVGIWETFKDEAERIALDRLGNREAAKHLAGESGSSHAFDITNGEAYALRTLGPRDWRTAADATFAVLEQKFKSRDVAQWREPRKMYDVTAQGAGSAEDIPFFDRGTWEQIVEVGA
jgi:acyl-homoserine lactone acylase PvdQ